MLNKKANINTPEFWDQEFQKELDDYLNQNISSFSRWEPPRFEIIGNEISNINGKLIDVGCGLGWFLRYMNARYPTLDTTGTDHSQLAVDTTIAFGGKAFQSDCYKFARGQEGVYDYVSAQEIIEHVSSPSKLLKECKQALRPGGKVLITTPVRGRYIEADDHMQEFSPKELTDLMGEYFENVNVADYNLFQLATGIKA